MIDTEIIIIMEIAPGRIPSGFRLIAIPIMFCVFTIMM